MSVSQWWGLLILTGEILWQHKASINHLNSVKSWIKAFRKNKKKPLVGVGRNIRLIEPIFCL